MKTIIIIIIFLLSVSCVYAMNIYDDFETGSIEAVNWTIGSGTPTISSTQAYEGTYSVYFSGSETLFSDNLDDYISATGRTILQFYWYRTQNAFSLNPNMYKDDGTTLMSYMTDSYPTANEWGLCCYGGWISTGLSSNSGRGDDYNDWVRYRILVDNINDTWSVRIGETSTNDIHQRAWAAAGNAQEIRLSAVAVPSGYYDYFVTWDFDTEGGWELYVPPADTAPGIINSTYNMTSDGGDIGWTHTPRVIANTTDGTPTFAFDTNVSANCSAQLIADVYTPGYKIATTGGTTHIATMFSNQSLSYGTNNIYVACKNKIGEVNSSALPINMTAGTAGAGLISCINVIGSGCGVTIADNCAAIIQT